MSTYYCGCNHRHSIFCIVPPHMLRALARNGNEEERGYALDTLYSLFVGRSPGVPSPREVEASAYGDLPRY